MAIQIIKKGISDSIQDEGRYGYQEIGIPPAGYMDYLSAQLANYILGNPLHNPVFELHFPASSFKFDSTYTICITGANFVPILNEKSVELNKPIQVFKNDTLQFLQPVEGKIAYLAIMGSMKGNEWLNSVSYLSKRIEKNDTFFFENDTISDTTLPDNSLIQKRVEQVQKLIFHHNPLRFIPGPAWNHLSEKSLTDLINKPFNTTIQSNRMGYALKGQLIHLVENKSYLSSAVTRGTMQLLPNGELIILMADHQTIGGYANIGQIILVDLPKLAQLNNNAVIQFNITTTQIAHTLYKEIQDWFK